MSNNTNKKRIKNLVVTATNAVTKNRIRIIAVTVMALILILLLVLLVSKLSVAYFMICAGCVTVLLAYANIGHKVYNSIHCAISISLAARVKLWFRSIMFLVVATPLVLTDDHGPSWFVVVRLVWLTAEVIGLNYRIDQLDRRTTITVEDESQAA